MCVCVGVWVCGCVSGCVLPIYYSCTCVLVGVCTLLIAMSRSVNPSLHVFLRKLLFFAHSNPWSEFDVGYR